MLDVDGQREDVVKRVAMSQVREWVRLTPIEASFPGVEEQIVSLAIAQPQKPNHGSAAELHGRPTCSPGMVFGLEP